MDHGRLLLWLSGRTSERGGARSHWWRSPDGDVWEEDMSGTDPGVGPSGSSMQKLTMADGGTGSELFPRTKNCWIGFRGQ